MNDEWRSRYEQRINSPEWKTLKFKLMQYRGSRCEKCEINTTFLELHHLTYDRLGRELPSDLQLLCHHCHVIADKQRSVVNKRRGMQRAYYTRYNNAYDTYVSKKYGEGWNGDASEEFNRWLDRKENDY